MANGPEGAAGRVREEQKATGGYRKPVLCQPDDRKSCAWCCGLYNVRDSGKEHLVRRLRRRTRNFARTARDAEAIVGYGQETKAEERLQLLDPDFYSCEFTGFLDANETRVGCLLNPMSHGNDSTDWRGLSFHGGSACGGFLCRAFRELSPVEREVVLATIDDWYLYGLIISDVDFVKAVMRLVELALGRSLTPEQGLSPPVLEAIYELFRWKVDPPFAHRSGRSVQPLGAGSAARVEGNSLFESWPGLEGALAGLRLGSLSPRERAQIAIRLDRLLAPLGGR
jgi:hypothetical protein